MLHTLLGILVMLFPLSEVALGVSRHARGAETPSSDRGSLRLLWIVIVVSVGLGVACSDYEPMRIHAPLRVVQLMALIFLFAGLALRWISVLVLGRYFTVNVVVASHQRVVDSGPYRFVRHPSYSGLLLAFIGLGLYFDDWLSIFVIVLPVTVALMYRIRIEEAALKAAIGPDYVSYCARTKRLVPGIL